MSKIDKATRDVLIETAHAVAEAARGITLPFFRSRDLATENKRPADFDPVTLADQQAEQAMRAVIDERRPADGILGEEFGAKPGTSGFTWVLDPIDGTRGFISGTPTWGTLVSVRDATGPLFGIIDQPYIGEQFCGGLGLSHLIRNASVAPMGVNPAATLSDAILFTTFPEVGTPADGAAFRALSQKVKLTRYGMDCYAYALLAAGHVDLVVEAGLNAYDIQAPIAVIQAAGGIVTNWEGGPAHDGGRAIAASNAALHAQAMHILQGSLNSGPA